jgi:hypothetical protein
MDKIDGKEPDSHFTIINYKGNARDAARLLTLLRVEDGGAESVPK